MSAAQIARRWTVSLPTGGSATRARTPRASANTYVTRSICCSINVRRMTEFEGWCPGEGRCQSAFKFGSDAILMMDQLAESVFVESIQQHSVSIGSGCCHPSGACPTTERPTEVSRVISTRSASGARRGSGKPSSNLNQSQFCTPIPKIACRMTLRGYRAFSDEL